MFNLFNLLYGAMPFLETHLFLSWKVGETDRETHKEREKARYRDNVGEKREEREGERDRDKGGKARRRRIYTHCTQSLPPPFHPSPNPIN